MANTIQLKRGTGSSEPSSLAEGELAINLDSGKLFYGSGSSVLSDFKVDTLTAETYVVSSSVTHMTTSFSSGSTAFGDSAGDAHTFTGDITASGIISASGDIIGQNFTAHDIISTSFTGSVDNPAIRLGPLSGNASGNKVGIMLEDAVAPHGLFIPWFVSNGAKVFGFGGYMDMQMPIYMGNNKIVFDGDSSNTFIYADTSTPENIEIHADGNIELRAQDDLQVYSDVDVTGEITASGHISSSANVYAADYFDNGVNINTLYAQVTGSDDNYVTDAEKTVIGNTSNTNSGDITVTGTPDYITISGQEITRNAIDLTTDVTGLLPDANMSANTAHLSGTQAFTGQKTFSTTVYLNGLTVLSKRLYQLSGASAGDFDGGDVVYFGGGTSLTAGTIYHYNASSTWEVADPNGVATCDGLLAVALGGTPGTDGMLLRGMVTLDHDPGTTGDVLYLSNTPGDASSTAPSDSDDVVRIIGYCLGSTNKKIWFNPDSTFVEIA